MDGKILNLTNAVYKVLEYFPENDPLKNRTKDKALAVMESMNGLYGIEGWSSLQNEKTKLQIAEGIDTLLGYLWIAKTQRWLNSMNYLIISNEYEKIRKGISPYVEFTRKIPKIAIDPPKEELPERQEKIMAYLKKNEKAQVMDLQKMLPKITKRTIRRDLDNLLKSKRIIRAGEFNQVFYKIKS